jgi:hypothetical protein
MLIGQTEYCSLAGNEFAKSSRFSLECSLLLLSGIFLTKPAYTTGRFTILWLTAFLLAGVSIAAVLLGGISRAGVSITAVLLGGISRAGVSITAVLLGGISRAGVSITAFLLGCASLTAL